MCSYLINTSTNISALVILILIVFILIMLSCFGAGDFKIHYEVIEISFSNCLHDLTSLGFQDKPLF